jgi:selenide,water dikinase
LAEIAGVHAVTDVTGFGLLGHLSEICKASGVAASVTDNDVPIFDGAHALAQTGVKTGASGRNWESVKEMIDAPLGWPDLRRDLLCDPQTSGGLLVSCAPAAVNDVLAAFAKYKQHDACVIGAVEAGAPMIRIS